MASNRLRRSDGEYRWTRHWRAALCVEWHFPRVYGSAIDITERRLAEETAHNLAGELIHAKKRSRRVSPANCTMI